MARQETLTVPLTNQDQAALSELFEQLQFEDIKQIEASSTPSLELLEPWEEQGWVINSSLPLKKA